MNEPRTKQTTEPPCFEARDDIGDVLVAYHPPGSFYRHSYVYIADIKGNVPPSVRANTARALAEWILTNIPADEGEPATYD